MTREAFLGRGQESNQSEKRIPVRPSIVPVIAEGDNRTTRERIVPKHEYTTMDRRNLRVLFDSSYSFATEDNRASYKQGFGTPAQEVVPEAQENREAESAREQALEIPKGLEGEELLRALETKLANFTAYFDTKWKGRTFGNKNLEKEADLDCLAALQGRVSGERARIQRHNFTLRRTQERAEDVARINQVELEQMRADLVSAQGKLLEELRTTPMSEGDTRRQIHERMRILGKLLKPENEQSLRTWWNDRAAPSGEMISGADSGFSKF